MYLMQVDPQSSAILGTIKVDDIICRGERNSLLPQQGYKKLSVYGTWKKKKRNLLDRLSGLENQSQWDRLRRQIV